MQKMRKMSISILLAVSAFALWSLATGAAYLGAMLPGGLPIGNLLSALGLCAVAGSAVLLSTSRTVLRIMSVISLAASLAWLPVSMVLAGNLALNFEGWRGSVWLAYTIAVIAISLCSLILTLVSSLLAMRGRSVD